MGTMTTIQEVEMRYMQIERGQKLHLVHEIDIDNKLSPPICGRGFKGGEKYSSGYRMTINLPWSLGMACKNCWRVYNARTKRL